MESFNKPQSAADRHRRLKSARAEADDIEDATSTSSAIVRHRASKLQNQPDYSTKDDTQEENTEGNKDFQKRKIWQPAELKVDSEEKTESRKEQLERLQVGIEIIKAEIAEWEIETIAQYEQAVAILIQDHHLSPEDAMTMLMARSTNMSHRDKNQVIKATRLEYGLDLPEKNKWFEKTR